MNQTMKILDTWSIVANQLRMRDRSVKTLQYGCQMLLGFYANQLKKETHEMLTLFRRTASTSRKAFWIFKSVNHITNAIHLVQNLIANDFSWQTFFDLLEQIFLASYFVFENFVFFVRVKVLPWNESDVEQWLFQHWFLSDLFGVISSLVRFCGSWYSIFGQSADISMECEASVLKFRRFYFDLSALIYSTMEVLVSGDFVGVFRKAFGISSFGDGYVGFLGMMSSLIILGDGAARVWIDLSDKEKKTIN